jgi:hypothetical protein
MFFFDLTSERALPPPAKVPKREPGAAAGAAARQRAALRDLEDNVDDDAGARRTCTLL